MSLKKFLIIPAIVTVALGGINTASAGTVTEACYATKSCGAKPAMKWIMGATGLGVGAAVGAATGTIFGPLGSTAGLVAGGYYGAKLGGKMGAAYSANEYIYFEDGTCLECDKHQFGEDYECPHGSVVTNGTKAYKCYVTASGDYWEEFAFPVCNDSPVKEADLSTSGTYKSTLKDNITNNGKSVKNGVNVYSGAVCIWIEQTSKNCTWNGTSYKPGSELDSCDGGSAGKKEHCIHLTHTCKNEGVWNVRPETLECEKGWKSNGGKTWDTLECVKEEVNPPKPRQTCEQMHAGYPERIACCKAGSTTKWSGDKATGTCTCVDTAKKWTFDSKTGRGQCLASGEQTCEEKFKGNAEAIQCCLAGASWENAKCNCGSGKNWNYKDGKGECVDGGNEPSGCTYTFNGRVKCANGNSMNITEQKQLTKAELGNLTCEQFNSMYQADVNKLNQFFTNQCAGGAFVTIVTGPSAAEVESAKSTLSAFFSAAQSNASVWKDSEGKFNKARLASDLTAGVVLGSVGGVVSGVVIKKKQVQKGFEALHCAVGGQTIADWGDEFNVGLRR